jgi:hypothetical protein
MPFVKGQSGNPGGRRKVDGDLRELARSKSPEMLQVLIGIAEDESKPAAARTNAASAVLDRAYGKPAQMLGDSDGNPLDWIDVLTLARARRMERDDSLMTH